MACTALIGAGVFNEGASTELVGFGNVNGLETNGCSKEPKCPAAFVSGERSVKLLTVQRGTEKELIARHGAPTLPWKGEVTEGTEKKRHLKISGVHMTLVDPCDGFEIPMEGTLEPFITNGTKNGLHPSSLTFEGKGGAIQTGHLIVGSFPPTENEVFVSGKMTIVGTSAQQLITAE
jgi:hypothetical protein